MTGRHELLVPGDGRRVSVAGRNGRATTQGSTALTRLRWRHEAAVLKAIATPGGSTRAQIGADTGLSRTTLHAIISRLIGAGAVIEQRTAQPESSMGRPTSHLLINPVGGHYLGVDMGRRDVWFAVANCAFTIVGTTCVPLPKHRDRAARAAAIADMASEFLASQGLPATGIRGIGLGVTGPTRDDQVRAAPVPPSDEATPVEAAALVAALDAPIAVGNNSRLAALGELTWGVANGYTDVVYLRVGAGIGGGVILGGTLLTGRRGAAGEIGHVTVDADGPRCYCGSRGCLETYASEPAVLRQAGARGLAVRDAAALVAAAAGGSADARDLLTVAGRQIGAVLAGISAVIDPELFVIDGQFVRGDTSLVRSAARTLREYSVRAADPAPRVQAAALGPECGALGAIASIAQQQYLI